MIAGALGGYHRAVVVGDRTYGKGCAQEYLDDDAHAGVLRLTTLLFALPDGSPVQKTGIAPNGSSPCPPRPSARRCSTRRSARGAAPTCATSAQRDVPWPDHAGRVGPCHDAVVPRAARPGRPAAAAR